MVAAQPVAWSTCTHLTDDMSSGEVRVRARCPGCFHQEKVNEMAMARVEVEEAGVGWT